MFANAPIQTNQASGAARGTANIHASSCFISFEGIDKLCRRRTVHLYCETAHACVKGKASSCVHESSDTSQRLGKSLSPAATLGQRLVKPSAGWWAAIRWSGAAPCETCGFRKVFSHFVCFYFDTICLADPGDHGLRTRSLASYHLVICSLLVGTAWPILFDGNIDYV